VKKRRTPTRSRRSKLRPVRRSKPTPVRRAIAPRPVTAADLRALRRELERRVQPNIRPVRRGGSASARTRSAGDLATTWNPDAEDVQKSVAQLVLTLVEFLRRLMERQAIRRMEQKTLTEKEVEAVGVGLMKLEHTIRDIGKRFGLTPEELNLDLGPLKLM
jgi:hypothetical protein